MASILVVDDEEAILTMITDILEEEGHEVRAVASGQEALDMLGAWVPDMLLTDQMMPAMSGVELCNILARDPRFDGLRIIFMSATRQHRFQGQCRFDAYLAKPFSLEQLLDTMDGMLAH